jgi:hypothetical protein
MDSSAYSPQIVLLAGWAGSGKDLFGAYLTKNHGYRRYAFADPVKDLVAAGCGIDRASLDTAEGKAAIHGPTGQGVRQLLISYAEESRAADPTCWASAIASRILADKPPRVVVTDWRHLDEFFALQRAVPAATFYFLRCTRYGERYSSVPDATEYGLLGFPFDAELQPTACINTKFLLWEETYRSDAQKIHALLKITPCYR